ncbi:MAG: c-type cytochrome, partial [Ginsengibacter sp.]
MKIFLITIFFSASIFLFSISFSKSYQYKTTLEDSLDKDRMKYMNEVMASIKGKEKMRADSVFKNLKVIKGQGAISAEHLLWMMNWGWSKELGVSCSYCHVKDNWESDALKTKDITRGMWLMRVQINKVILPQITGRDYEASPKVSCITCHRGKPVPDEY